MEQQFEQIQDYPTLTDSQRIQARDNARRNVIATYAKKPDPDQFRANTRGDYPRAVVVLVTMIMLGLLAAAFVPSAYRVYEIASSTFSGTVENEKAGNRVGYAFIMLAETGQIGFTLAAGVLILERRAERWTLHLAALISTILALVANVQLALGSEWLTAIYSDTFAWIEAYSPPILVIFSATVLKHFLLSSIRQHHAATRAYEEALHEYKQIVNDPESHSEWQDNYGSALWEMWRKVYSGRLTIQQISRIEARQIAMREMGFDKFFQDEFLETFRNNRKPEPEKTVSQQEVIAYLEANPGAETMKQSEIAEITGASPATVSRAFSKLSRNGHERTDDGN